ncbi:MAG TPA: hypothetical protein VK589_15965 [Chryseolinea sp.]|nr:hypothetical protein [Chryseolinea sp.]
MENGGHNKLRSLLKKFEIRTPPPTFTGEVVREIEAMADDKVYASARMKGMLQKNVAHSPSAGFTYKVLNHVREQSHAPYPPIIGKKTWGAIVAFIVVCVMVALMKEPLDANNSVLRYLPVGEFLSSLTRQFAEPLLYSAVVILSAGLLLGLDYLIGKGRRSRRSG